MKLTTILVTGAGGAPSTNFIRSLRKSRHPYTIIGTDADPYYLFRSEADTNYLVPTVSDPLFIPIINDIIKKHSIDFIHSQNDEEVFFISEHRGEFAAKTFLPNKQIVAICQDKYQSYLRWKEKGLTVPLTYRITSVADLRKAFERLGSKLWLRSIKGAAGKWSLPVSSFDVAKAWIDAHNGWGDFTAASQLESESITWMSLWHEGKLLLAQGRKRLYWEMAKVSPSGITGVTGGGETVSDKNLDAIAQQAIAAIDPKPHGLYAVDLTFDHNHIPNPTEINIGRFFTTHHFFTEAGINMPHIYVSYGLGRKVALPKKNINPLPAGLVWIRGVDFHPILKKRTAINQAKKELEKRIKRIS